MASPAIPEGRGQPDGCMGSGFAWAVAALVWFAYFLNDIDRQVVFSIFPVLDPS
jgi:hypothetical protein